MMGRQGSDQSQLIYLFNLEERVPQRHLLRQINLVVTRLLGDLRRKLEPLYSDKQSRLAGFMSTRALAAERPGVARVRGCDRTTGKSMEPASIVHSLPSRPA